MALTGPLFLIEAAETEVSRYPSSGENFFFVNRTHVADGESGVVTEVLSGDMVSMCDFLPMARVSLTLKLPNFVEPIVECETPAVLCGL